MSPKSDSKQPTTAPTGPSLTPAEAMRQLAAFVSANPFASGAQAQAVRTVGFRLNRAIQEHQAAIQHAAELENELPKLVAEAVQALIKPTKPPGKTNGAAEPTTSTAGVK